MIRALGALLAVAVAAAVVVLSVANRQPVPLALPFAGGEPVATAPLYVLLFAATGLGAVAGGLAVWLGEGPTRREARAERREATRLRRELEAARAGRVTLPAPSRR